MNSIRKIIQPFLEEKEEKHVKEEEKRELKKRHEEKDANQEREKPREDTLFLSESLATDTSNES